MRIDHHALFKPLTKATISFCNHCADETMRRAMAIAMEDPPGPVHLDLPEDIAQANAGAVAQSRHEPSRQPDLSPELTRILSTSLAQARRPLAWPARRILRLFRSFCW
jgi:acetolactate synthase-1/2/3 large subunit